MMALTDGVVLAEAPSDLTFKFTPGQTIDTTTIGTGIVITRAGDNGTFETATVTPWISGRTASDPAFRCTAHRHGGEWHRDHAESRCDAGCGAASRIAVGATAIVVSLNPNGGGTTGQQLVNAINDDADASALVKATVTAGGAGSVATGLPAGTILTLSGASLPSVTSDLSTSTALRFK